MHATVAPRGRGLLFVAMALGAACSDRATSEPSAPDASSERDASVDSPITLGNRWTSRTSLPAPRVSFGHAVVGDRLYVVGGTDDAGDSARVDVYDPSADAWTAGPALPSGRTSVAAAAVGKTLCVFGGLVAGQPTAETLCLDTADTAGGAWQTMAPLATPRSLVASTASGDRVYAIGGRERGGVPTAATASFDPTANAWRDEPPLPKGREGGAAVVLGGQLLVAGGFSIAGTQEEYFDDVLALDENTKSWIPRGRLTERAVALAGTQLDRNRALFVGGYVDRGEPFLDRAETLDLSATGDAQGVSVTALPEGRGGLGVAVVARRVFAFGGGVLLPPKPWTPRADVWELTF